MSKQSKTSMYVPKVQRTELKTPIQSDYVVFDFETTGPSMPGDEIMEIGAMKCTYDGKEIARFSELINPNCPIGSYVSMLTGISKSMVASAPPMEYVFPKFLDFIGDLPLVGHGIKAFDFRFLDGTCFYGNYPFKTNDYIDTVNVAHRVLAKANLTKFSVESLIRYFGLKMRSAHRAMNDTLMENDVYQSLRVCMLAEQEEAIVQANLLTPVSQPAIIENPKETVSALGNVISQKTEQQPNIQNGLIIRLFKDYALAEIYGYIPELREYVKNTSFVHWEKDVNRWMLRIDGPLGTNLFSLSNSMASMGQQVSVFKQAGELVPITRK